ncbi:hypothetical protein MMC34_008500 [Xylographa carneopallida]|nr:hypothetical protein [Xylographa carneopallida]
MIAFCASVTLLACLCLSYGAALSLSIHLSPTRPVSLTPSVHANTFRLARVLDRLHQGLPVVVGTVGGSNMQGRLLNRSDIVLSLVTSWLNERYPVNASAAAEELRSNSADSGCPLRKVQTTHTPANYAIGGTTSALSSFCYHRLVPRCSEPDLILVDFAVNDVLTEDDSMSRSSPALNIERLIRQVLGDTASSNSPALLMLHFAMQYSERLVSAESLHHPVAAHYHIPEFSIRSFMVEWLAGKPKQCCAEQYLPSGVQAPLREVMQQLKNNSDDMDRAIDRALWHDAYHLSERGHRVLASMVNKELTTLYSAFERNNRTSLVDSIHLPLSWASARLPPLLQQRPVLVEPLDTALQGQSPAFSCSIMYPPYNRWADHMNQTEAELFLFVESNQGWVYGRQGQHSNKFAMTSTAVGDRLMLAFPGVIQSLSLVMVRSWNTSRMGGGSAWLSCSRQVEVWDARGTAVYLNGSWAHHNTQLDLVQIAAPMQPRGEGCEIRFLHLLHTDPGELQLVGHVHGA